MRFRRWLLATGVTGLLCAFPGVALAAPSSGAWSQAPSTGPGGLRIMRLTAGVQMTKDDKAARAFTGPTSMLVDPVNPRIVVAATSELRTKTCYLLRSNDAGHTWHILPAVPALGTYQYCTNGNASVAMTSLAWGRNSTLYYALNGYGTGEGGRAGHASILLARSNDLGQTWSTTVVDNNRGKTGVAPTDNGVTGLAVDTSGPHDVVYVGFTQSHPTAPKGSPLQNGRVDVAVSSNGGVSFARPVNLNSFSHVTQTIAGKPYPLVMRSFFGAPFLTVHHGVVEAVAGSQTPSGVTLPGPPSIYHAMPQMVARSTDQGRTWSVSTLGPPVFTGAGAQTAVGWTPKGGSEGTFLAAYAATPASASSSGLENIVLQRSTDLGRTWTNPVIIDKPSKQFTNFYPQMGVAPDGRVDVVWEDNLHLHDYLFQVAYSYSSDGGVTWARTVQVSDQPTNFGLGVSFNSDIRQPPGVASANRYAAFGWADTRLGNAANSNQDDFGDAAQFAPLPATSSAVLPVLSSAFAGLGAAGLVIIVALGVRRRRQGEPPPKAEERAPARVG